jgi:hypothetical protein
MTDFIVIKLPYMLLNCSVNHMTFAEDIILADSSKRGRTFCWIETKINKIVN